MIDRSAAVAAFRSHVNGISRLPLIADEEMRRLFGSEVWQTLARLDRFGDAGALCRECGARCCLVARCELYAPEFGHCPIHRLRPVVCRLHYCHRFQAADPSAQVALSDVFFDSLLTAEREGNALVRLFDSPPLAALASGLVAASGPWLEAVAAGTLSPQEGMNLILREAERVATPLWAIVPPDAGGGWRT